MAIKLAKRNRRRGTAYAAAVIWLTMLCAPSVRAMDEQEIPLGQGLANTPCVLVGPNSQIDSTPAGDDQASTNLITSGADGICDTPLSGDDVRPAGVVQGGGLPDTPVIIAGTVDGICDDTIVAVNDDVVITPAGQGKPRQAAIRGGPDDDLDSIPAGDDVATSAICGGANGDLESVPSGDDAFGSAFSGICADVCVGPTASCIIPGDDEVLDSTVDPLDDEEPYVSTGLDGVADTTADAGDQELIEVGKGWPNTTCVTTGTDGIADTTICGNGVDDYDENGFPNDNPQECDDGNTSSNDGCDDICIEEFCGDGIIQTGIGEVCDNGANNSNTQPDACRLDCTPAGCGDGVTDTGEVCDDGNEINGDGCDDDTVSGGNCTVTACGNGVVAGSEVCDDGNTTNGDGCDDGAGGNCTVTACGNGVVTAGEQCDDGNETIGDGCDDGAGGNCTVTACGNGVITGSEVCDDGNVTNGDGCDDGAGGNCTVTACGNGVVTAGEQCDDGNETIGDGCDDGAGGNCTVTACGNGVVTAGEQCDDANADNSDTCLTTCAIATCGDGFVCTDNQCSTGPGGDEEECDDGAGNSDAAPDACRTGCALPTCGDGVTDPGNGEGCDDSGESAACDADCTTAVCGDNTINATAGEQCDDGNLDNDDPCLATCLPATCGDGFLCTDNQCNTGPGNNEEECDDGVANSDSTPDACRTTCAEPSCGDGVTDPSKSEQCDDAGESTTCNDNCTTSVCGDGFTNQTAGEECDDADADNNDPCLDTCVEAICGDAILCTDPACSTGPQNGPETCDNGGANSDTTPEACRTSCQPAFCGDGVVDPGNSEVCDDGDNKNNDECVQGCVDAFCGDGYKWQGVEGCDDGNNDAGDGCAADCTKEPDISCGNGIVDQACSAGLFGEPCTMDEDCDTAPAAGDGTCEFEACDDGNNSNRDDCTNDCQPAVCGDGFKHTKGTPPFEACDDGGTTPGDGCDPNCQNECGNGVLDGACSQPPSSVGQGCLANDDCDSAPAAGDGVCAIFEECDTALDGLCFVNPTCSAECLISECGNSVVECNEQCDLGALNGVIGSGCEIDCTANLIGRSELTGKRECPGAWLLVNPPNEVKRRTQRCSDGASCDGDALSGQCTFSLAYCLNRPQPSSCTPGKIVAIDFLRIDVVEDQVGAQAVEALTEEIESLSPSADTPARCVEGLEGKICGFPEHTQCDTFFGAGDGVCDPTGTGVLFDPPLDPASLGGDQLQTCTTPRDIVVPDRGRLRLQALIRRDELSKDKDSLKLVCR